MKNFENKLEFLKKFKCLFPLESCHWAKPLQSFLDVFFDSNISLPTAPSALPRSVNFNSMNIT